MLRKRLSFLMHPMSFVSLLCTFYPTAYTPLGTPLTLIAGPINDCLNEIKDQKVRNKLQMAGRNVDRLSRLVDSLMDFSRLEAGRLEGLYLLPGKTPINTFQRSICTGIVRSICGRVGNSFQACN